MGPISIFLLVFRDNNKADGKPLQINSEQSRCHGEGYNEGPLPPLPGELRPSALFNPVFFPRPHRFFRFPSSPAVDILNNRATKSRQMIRRLMRLPLHMHQSLVLRPGFIQLIWKRNWEFCSLKWAKDDSAQYYCILGSFE